MATTITTTTTTTTTTYAIKPFRWARQKGPPGWWEPKPRFLHRSECTDDAFYSFGGRGLRGYRKDKGRNKFLREVWKFDFLARKWTKLQVRKLPDPFAMCCAVLRSGNLALLSHGSCTEEGDDVREDTFVAQLPRNGDRKITFNRIARCPFMVVLNQNLVQNGESLYKIERTGYNALQMDTYALQLRTGKWSLVSDGIKNDGPQVRRGHKTVSHQDRIYVFGGGTPPVLPGNFGSYTFEELPAFDVKTNRWQLLRTVCDPDCDEKFPAGREHLVCVRVPGEPSLVYITGGIRRECREAPAEDPSNVEIKFLDDTWRIDLNTLQWKRITSLTLPHGLFHHSSSITPDGRMCVFGGITHKCKGSADLLTSWVTIPKLADACWEAVQHYIRNGTIALPKDVRKLGLPKKYEDRLLSSALVRCTTGRKGCACLWCLAR